MKKRLTFVVCGVLALATTVSTGLALEPQSKCLVSKNKCVAKKAGSLLQCGQRAETPGKSTNPNFGTCEGKARDKFGGGSDPTKGCFFKLEHKTPNDCITFNDSDSLEQKVEDCVDDIVGAIDPPPLDQ